MHDQATSQPAGVREPWFRERPYFTVAVSVVLFVAIFVIRLLVGDVWDNYSMLYTLPVALLATAFGRRAGTIAGLVGMLLVVVWVVADDVPMRPVGWVARFLPLLLLGVLLGDASDRLRRGEEERVQLAAAARLHREAIEINDSLVQGMAAAKWSLEAGRTETGLRTLEETIALGHQLVSGLIRDAGLGPEAESTPRLRSSAP
jgi:hypothetical protein